jgi:hypothetical protein
MGPIKDGPNNNNNNKTNNKNNNNNNKQKSKSSPNPNKVRGGKGTSPIGIAYSDKQSFPRKNVRSERFKNCEAIGTMLGSVAYTIATKFYINPGLATSFPWLSVQAQRWQQYRFHSLKFIYISRSASTAPGSVIMSPDYNSFELQPATEAIASNTQDAVENSCWARIECPLDIPSMFPLGPRKLIRSANIAGDLSTYDAGRFFLCTVGMASAIAVGRLWVEYDVELFVPQSTPATLTSPQTISQYTAGAIAQSLVTGVGAALNWDTNLYDPLGAGLAVLGVITPPLGVYHVYGIFSVSTSIATNLQVSVQVLKNNASLTTQPIVHIMNMPSSVILPIVSMSFDDIVVISAPGDNIRVLVTATGTGVISVSNTAAALNLELC